MSLVHRSQQDGLDSRETQEADAVAESIDEGEDERTARVAGQMAEFE